ncbi:hypothetical protein INT48_008584 [Thamnidium elegans]|uniref:Uncharacterized protein n=1 Tax=Thamnidium elegans TaxID=101142 RepID=A0A8H7SVA7_9FUNG|nr:hypothetical protein INT48_008584 [Thamnidium elegans]
MISSIPKISAKWYVNNKNILIITNILFFCSEQSTDSDISSSQSSYALSEIGNACSYICKHGFPELDTKDIPDLPCDIADIELADMVSNAQLLISNNGLFPSDEENRLRASCIFQMDGNPIQLTAYLPDNVSLNIVVFKRAIQRNDFYKQSNLSDHLKELALNNIISSTYLFHGKERFKNKGSELNLIASSVSVFLSPFFSAHDAAQIEFDAVSWVFKQSEKTFEDKLRPDILIHAKQYGEIIEVGCSEVKNIGTSEERLKEDKIRVLEIMKRQLHVRMKHAKSVHEVVTFGILVQGMSVILLRMTMDLDKGVYFYSEQSEFILPTSYKAYSHMDTSMELFYNFKNNIMDSLARSQDAKNDNIWNIYKNHVKPTISSFTPVYPS